MLLSVVIPAYNVEQYIENCLHTLMRQGMDTSDYEVIVINDGSTDGTQRIVEEWRQKHENIRVITTENKGQSSARNLGMEMAKGDYIHFVDADDYIAYGSYRIIARYANDGNDVIYFEKKDVGEETSDYYGNELKAVERYETGIEFTLAHTVYDNPFMYWVKREYYIREKLHFIPGIYYEDGPFTRTMLNHCGAVVYLGLDVYRYVMNPSSTVHNRGKTHQEKLTYSLLQVVAYMKDLYEQIRCETDNEQYILKIENRISRYIFFLQARLIRVRGGVSLAKRIIPELEAAGLYPYSGAPYQGWKYTIPYFIFRRKWLYYGVLSTLRVIYIFK